MHIVPSSAAGNRHILVSQQDAFILPNKITESIGSITVHMSRTPAIDDTLLFDLTNYGMLITGLHYHFPRVKMQRYV
jgi:hypothetical protein